MVRDQIYSLALFNSSNGMHGIIRSNIKFKIILLILIFSMLLITHKRNEALRKGQVASYYWVLNSGIFFKQQETPQAVIYIYIYIFKHMDTGSQSRKLLEKERDT